jgi:molecular chaperone HtpG
MVSKKVEIITKSYKEGAQAVKWSLRRQSLSFTLENVDKAERGTDIVLYIDDDCKEFLEEARIEGLLKKYCTSSLCPSLSARRKNGKTASRLRQTRITSSTT